MLTLMKCHRKIKSPSKPTMPFTLDCYMWEGGLMDKQINQLIIDLKLNLQILFS